MIGRLRFAAALLAVVLCGSSALAQQSDVIRVGLGPTESVTPLVYAVKAGIYRRYGVSVELVKLTSGAAIAAAMSGGSLELGQATPLNLALALQRGLPFTVIGSLSSYNDDRPDTALLVMADSAIRTAKDLEGKTLAAVSLQDINSVATFAWLDARGVDRSTLKFAEVTPSATFAAMEQGRVDAATLYEPYFSSMLATGKVRVLGYPLGALAKHFAISLLFGTSAWVNGHRDAVERFLRASQEASLYVAAHEGDSPGLIADFTGLDPAVLAHIKHAGRGIAVSTADIQPIIDAATRYGVIPKSFPAADMLCSCALKR